VRSKSGPLSTSFLFTGEQFDAKARPPQAEKDVGLYYLRAFPKCCQCTGRVHILSDHPLASV
jgi:hypothetical protein